MNFTELFRQIETGIREVYDSSRYQNYLSVMSRFTQYSLSNTILIFNQRPDATLVAGYQAWRTKFNRHVKKGEKGIRILAPIRSPKEKDSDGTDPAEEAADSMRFRVISVFDISQTEGEPLPVYMNDTFSGSVAEYSDFLSQLIQVSPVPVHFHSLTGNVHGFYRPSDETISIREGMSQLQTIKTLAHEIAHALLHNRQCGGDLLSRRQKEIEAESIAYILCSHYGLDTSDYSFAYIAGYSSSRELPELQASMSRIHFASRLLIRQMDELRGHPEVLL
ncbi:MAG: ImmA/IrrE family metallo-endopeptidase [Solobacterium sp.]|nr:ImmA/IrrE family metallo-endopeptidase [Solobacterium sp.]